MDFLTENWQFLTGVAMAIGAVAFGIWYIRDTERRWKQLDTDQKAILLQLLNSIRNVEGKEWVVKGGDDSTAEPQPLPPIEIDPGKIQVHVDTQNWRVITEEHSKRLECGHSSNGRCKGMRCPAYRENLKEGLDGCVAWEALFEVSQS